MLNMLLFQIVETVFLLPKSAADYDYMSTFDSYAATGQGNYTPFTAGKMLGGSASLNDFYFIRGCPDDFDGWAAITGDDSWKYENFIEYFKKSERLEDDEIKAGYSKYHGTVGPIGLTRQVSSDIDPYLTALAEVGHPTVLDLNSNTTTGYCQPLYTIAEKIRQTPAVTYLKRVKNDNNFYVSKNTRVTKVIFENNTAVAVEAFYNGNKYILRANKEIILCAGVFSTPQILMLSGIGPADHLNDIGIKVLSNLPVGNTFTDHVTTTLVYKTVERNSIQPNVLGINLNVSKIPFSVIIGSVPLNRTQKCADYQAYGLLFDHDTQLLTFICKDIFFYRSEICNSWQQQVRGRDSLYVLLANVTPKSKGTIRLNPNDPLGKPIITSGFFTDDEDLKNMVKYVQDFVQVGNSSFFKTIGAGLVGLDLPECAGFEKGTDAFWKCYILNRAISIYHGAGTCPMGNVVDGNLLVKGFQRLRIMDASVMPIIPKGGDNPAVLAIAEKGADIVKRQPYY